MEQIEKKKAGRPPFPPEKKKEARSYYPLVSIAEFIRQYASTHNKTESDVILDAIKATYKDVPGYPQ